MGLEISKRYCSLQFRSDLSQILPFPDFICHQHERFHQREIFFLFFFHCVRKCKIHGRAKPVPFWNRGETRGSVHHINWQLLPLKIMGMPQSLWLSIWIKRTRIQTVLFVQKIHLKIGDQIQKIDGQTVCCSLVYAMERKLRILKPPFWLLILLLPANSCSTLD